MKTHFFEQLSNWYNEEPGRTIHKIEINELKEALPNLFGYYLLQIGTKIEPAVLADCPIHNQYYLGPEIDNTKQYSSIQAEFLQLPIQPESVDAVIVFHALEFCTNPFKLLQEIYNSLIPGGSVIIFCFNPHSLLGIAKLWHNKQTAPWNGKLLSPWHLRKLLNKAKFTVGDYKTFFFRPLNKNEILLKKLLFMENIGQIFWPYFGTSYMFSCKKMAFAMKMALPECQNKKFVAVGSPIARRSKIMNNPDDNEFKKN